jgi:ATP-dependent protease Clp ATPase subunit
MEGAELEVRPSALRAIAKKALARKPVRVAFAPSLNNL